MPLSQDMSHIDFVPVWDTINKKHSYYLLNIFRESIVKICNSKTPAYDFAATCRLLVPDAFSCVT